MQAGILLDKLACQLKLTYSDLSNRSAVLIAQMSNLLEFHLKEWQKSVGTDNECVMCQSVIFGSLTFSNA